MICASRLDYVLMIDCDHAHAVPRSQLRTMVWVGRSCGRQEAACVRRVARSLAESGRRRRSPDRLRFHTRAVDDLRDLEEPQCRRRALSARDHHFRGVLHCCLRPHYLQQEGLPAIRRC